MRTFVLGIALITVSSVGCQKSPEKGDSDKPVETKTKAPASSSAPKPDDVPAPPDVAAPPSDASKTAKGVSYKVLKSGAGTATPLASDTVEVHYTGWTTDGKMFDSSKKRGKPAKFSLKQVIPGWTDGIQVMKEGDSVRFWIPEELAYKGKPGRPQGMLVFDVELLKIYSAPKTPENVAAAPADAKKTKSGLAYKVISKGPDAAAPVPRLWDEVEVHYTGWTTDGKMFDSSMTRGRPAKFGLYNVIAGWTEGLQLMNKGDKVRFWIPVDLAYKGAPGKPAGDLVFEVELLSVKQRPEPPSAPKRLKRPASGAKKTKSGLAYKKIKSGTGKVSPTENHTVRMHYTGWTIAGKMFDSTVPREQPATFPMRRAPLEGWKEGLQLMKEGDTFLFWVPEELAFKKRRGAPEGALVFQVELVKVIEPAARPKLPKTQKAAPGKPGATPPAVKMKAVPAKKLPAKSEVPAPK